MPSTATDVIDGVSTSTAAKAPVRGIIAGNHSLSGLSAFSAITAAGTSSLTPADDERWLAANQTTAAARLIYISRSGAWEIAPDSDGARDLRAGTLVFTQDGLIYGLDTSDPIVPGTTSLTWSVRNDIALSGLLAAASGSSLVGHIAAGTGAVARTVQGKLRELLYITDFSGVDPTGVGDSTAGILAAEAARAAGQVLVWTPGTFKITDDITALVAGSWLMHGCTINSTEGRLIVSRDNFAIETIGVATFNFTGSATDTEYRRAIRAGGGLSAEYGVTGTIAVGDTSFVADTIGEAATLAAGDWVHVVHHDPSNYIRLEMKQVASVAGTTINLTSPFGQAFDATYPIEWLKVATKYENIKIKGLKIVCPDPGADGLAVDIQPGIFNFELSGCDITMDRGYGFAVYGVFNPNILNNRIRRHKGQTAAISTCQGGRTEGNTWFVEGDAGTNGALKLETGTYAHHLVGNQVFGLNGGSGAIYVNNVNHCVIADNTVVGRTSASNAFSINGASNNIFANNKVINCADAFVVSVDTAPTPDMASVGNTFVGNSVRNAATGITNGAGCTSTVLSLDVDATVTTPINNGGTLIGFHKDNTTGAMKAVGGLAVGNVAVANANVLDWYEEGTWTPALTFETAGDVNVAYTTQSGRYTRIGNKVFVDAYILTSTFTHTTAVGALKITGLPFGVATVQAIMNTLMQGYTKANYTQVAGHASVGDSFLKLLAGGSAQAVAFLAVADMPTGGTVSLRISGHYEV